MSYLIAGCGYLGSRVANRWLATGEPVHVLTRSATKAAALAAQGFRPIVADLAAGESLPLLPPVSTVLFAVGYDRGSSAPITEVYPLALANLLRQLSPDVERLFYISSTGVYGGGEGDWVSETSPCLPRRAGGVASLAAEAVLRASNWASRACILRLAGIYGPGRIPRKQDLLAGKPIEALRDGYLNLIHVEDAVEIITQLEAVTPPRLLNVADGHPVRRGDYYAELARLVGAPSPQFVIPETPSASYQRSQGDKRIDTKELQRLLMRPLRYPDYRAGLAAIVAEEAEPRQAGGD